jgi:hypothetical protein
MNIAQEVDAVITDCLFAENELIDGKPPEGAVLIEGIATSYVFHPGRIAAHTLKIAELCGELLPDFHKSGGGGQSFLNLCQDKHGEQWGEHFECEKLLVLAIATDQGGYLIPRAMWKVLPGAVPYVWLGA